VGPDALQNGMLRRWLRALPREQILTETNGPWSRLGTGDRAAALREILAALAETWRCTPEVAEAQIERNLCQAMPGLAFRMDSPVEHADQPV